MAKTLFFIEALALALFAAALPLVGSGPASAFLLPLAASLIVPLCGALAVWPARDLALALGAAFSSARPEANGAEKSARILKFLAGAAGISAFLGILMAAATLSARGTSPKGPAGWSFLGVFLAAYALANVQLGKILSKVVGRLAEAGSGIAPGGGRPEEETGLSSGFAEAYSLTPREAEAAACIARGMSYKETAYELGISIRTVKAHMGRVYEKTGAASNVALALLLRAGEAPTTKVQ